MATSRAKIKDGKCLKCGVKRTTAPCKNCQRNARIRYYYRNREEQLLKNKYYRERPEAKEKHRIWMAEWRENNPDKEKEITKRCREKHGERFNAERKEKYHTDPIFKAKKLEQDKRYKDRTHEERRLKRAKMADVIKERSKRYREKNPEKIKKKTTEYRNNHREELIQKERDRRDLLDDTHVKKVIARRMFRHEGEGISSKSIPPEIVKMEKLLLELKRLIKTKHNAKQAKQNKKGH